MILLWIPNKNQTEQEDWTDEDASFLLQYISLKLILAPKHAKTLS